LFNDRLGRHFESILIPLESFFASPQPSVSFLIQDGGISDYSSLAQDIHRSPSKIRGRQQNQEHGTFRNIPEQGK